MFGNILVTLFLASLPLMAVSSSSPPVSEEGLNSLVQDSHRFTFDLYQKLKQTEGNILFSPLSVFTTFGMIYAGAEGQTRQEIAETFHFGLPDSELHAGISQLFQVMDNGQLNAANRVWVQQGTSLSNAYQFLVEQWYKGGIGTVNFLEETEDARLKINAWVSERTKGKIPQLFDPGMIQPFMRLVITNAIHFKGKWKEQFKPENTGMEDFHLGPENTVKVPIMFRMGEIAHFYDEELGVQVAELPYESGQFSMVILHPLPLESQPASLTPLEEKLSTENLQRWLGGLEKSRLGLFLPKFQVRSGWELQDILAEMGTPTLFSAEAELTRMFDNERIFLTKVIHKTFVEVNEEGTEAAASTGTGGQSAGASFNVNSPFLYFIRHLGTGQIIFFGRVTDPRQ